MLLTELVTRIKRQYLTRFVAKSASTNIRLYVPIYEIFHDIDKVCDEL